MKSSLRLFLAALFAFTACIAHADPQADLKAVNTFSALPKNQQDAYCGEILRLQAFHDMRAMKTSRVTSDSVDAAIGRLDWSELRTDAARAENIAPETLLQVQHQVSKTFASVSKEMDAVCGASAFMQWQSLSKGEMHKLDQKGTAAFVAHARAIHLDVPASILPAMAEAQPGSQTPKASEADDTPLQPTPPVVTASDAPSTMQFMPPGIRDAFCAGRFKKEAVGLVHAMKIAGQVNKVTAVNAVLAYEYYSLLKQDSSTEGLPSTAFGGMVDGVVRGRVPLGTADANTCLDKVSQEWVEASADTKARRIQTGIRMLLEAARQEGLDIPLSVIPQRARDQALKN